MHQTLLNKINGVLAILKFDNWLPILVDRMLFRTPAIVYSLNGRPILIDHAGGDCGGTRDVLVSGMYDGYLAAIGSGVLRQVIDIGANGGGFSLCLLLRNDPVERLVCVEMNPNTFARLQYNVVRNRIGGERYCLNAAVNATAGHIDVRLGEGSAGDSLVNALAARDGEKYTVATITLRDIVDTYFPAVDVDLCKIDIEGGEYEILRTADEGTFGRIRYVLIEFHPTADHGVNDGLNMLRRLGFKEVEIVQQHDDVFLLENLRFRAA